MKRKIICPKVERRNCFFMLYALQIVSVSLLFQSIYAQDHDGPELLNDNTIKMTVVGNGYSDQTYVLIVPGSTTGFDSQYDAYKLMGIPAAPQLYSIISCCNLSVNALPEIYTNMVVQLGFEVGENTNYTLTTEGLYTFGQETDVILEDSKEGLFFDLKTDSIYTFNADPDDDKERFILHYNYPVKLDLKVYLEGPFNGSGMDTDLNSSGELPLNQPFNTTPWNYMGAESVASIPNSDVVDWLLIEIRDTTDASLADETTQTERKAVFLLNDGSVVALDGSSMPEFTGEVKNDLFLVVWHRNHLPVISSNPLVPTAGIHNYDFSTSASQALGGSAAQKDLGGGIYGMYAGDANADGTVDNSDKISFWQLIVGKRGYEPADYDLDGQVDNVDKNDNWFENIGKTSQLP